MRMRMPFFAFSIDGLLPIVNCKLLVYNLSHLGDDDDDEGHWQPTHTAKEMPCCGT